jgi:putative chitobiose transport system substrate-binding protein
MNLVIPRTSDDPDDALQFALFITNPENQLTFAQAAHVLPSTVKSLKDYEQELNRQGTQPTATLEQGLVVSVRQLYNTEVLVPAMTNVKGLQKILYENLQAAMLGTKSVDQALADAEQAWNSKR